ncbi:hypothetical protein [Streptomyces candidus]|uniref:Putative phage infection (PIP) family protein YhgE n=1 Tax=Streptomyces candidus TaxID=67283 RepID=A0A7X0HK54_9ACTN|nr:hypothetical protein [Streptomyces candidus]MBB6439091.1 putative phage infection (PIP) family protein YhgE [Streptomyces candidus]GHH55605.1 hypothetical protein GCM10018773_60320 [Streptomyces candidus]
MFRIISTARLNELDNLASAFPMVRSKSDRLEKDLETEQRLTKELTAKAEQATARFRQELTDLVQQADARVAEARASVQRAQHQANALIDGATKRANDIERRADQKVRELNAQIEQLKAKLPHPTPIPEGVVARYQNLVGALIDLTLFTIEDTNAEPGYGYSAKRVDLKLVSLCAGCGYRQEETRKEVYDTAETRTNFLENTYEGEKLKRWAQEHAETCRAVALPLQRAA